LSVSVSIRFFLKRKILNTLDTIDKQATSLLGQTNQTLEDEIKQENDLDKKLKNKEDAQAALQNQVSGNLQPIFWGIMVAIIAVLLILRVRSDALSMLMVRERVAVEMLSIGMFLVTVLFLGAGGFIEKATLGTLLGTLAGYLFTRRATPSSVSTSDLSTPALPDRPGKPAIDSAKKLTISKLPKGADHVAVFARQVRVAAGDPTF